ncbi:hypothetical protein [Candidatus Bodocaedibacter vickermanii]|uniref:Uncharacterized protein n=1 Tax=Candidatus Bodocaedibacter vickermanii TaxID=2741701 RepID=A0A7L9RV02_9PROT|nr:hypothetical protein CPBP_01187 [Candidatus Paracaedibacteraceae bacterium 'Lake Konstanz']
MKSIPMILTKEKLLNHTLKSLLITSMLTIPTVFASHDSLFGTNSDTQPAASATALGQPALVVSALSKEVERLRNLPTSQIDYVKESRNRVAPNMHNPETHRLQGKLVELYENDPKHRDVTREFIRFTLNNRIALGQPALVVPALLEEANRLRNLATKKMNNAEKIQLHTESAELYETAAKHPDAVPEFIRQAANNVSCLMAPFSDSALPLFELFVNSSGVTPWDIQEAADILNNWKKNTEETALNDCNMLKE